jgi:hypothetical protein
MKKVLIGCGLAVLLVVIAIAVVIFLVVREAKIIAAEVETLGKAYVETNRQFPFSPGDEGVAGDQLDRWFAVRRDLLPAVENFKNEMNSSDRKGALSTIGTMRKQGGAFVAAHMDALNANEMSADEYYWIARKVYTALGSGDALRDEELKEVLEALGPMGGSGGGPRGNANAGALYSPMTGEEIAAALAAIKERRDAFLETRGVILPDFTIGPIVDAINQGEGRRSRNAGVDTVFDEVPEEMDVLTSPTAEAAPGAGGP